MSKRQQAAFELGVLMSELSEEHCTAGWLIDWEYFLFSAVEVGGGSGRAGPFNPARDVSVENICKLRSLYQLAGGWCVLGFQGETVFVPLSAWLSFYERWDKRG